MRINLNNQVTIDQVNVLCQQLNTSPTRLIIDLIEKHHKQYNTQHYAQIGCKENANTEENEKDTLQ